ncbi:TPA: hypothetical protein PTV31_000839 [Clostridium botulinum]|nr:hypothetical protein [Clostridium botulinum]
MKLFILRTETVTAVEEHKTKDGSARFIVDLFIEEYGSLDSHKKWIQENSIFVIKNATENPAMNAEITVDEWLSLDEANQALYKKEVVLGDNTNTEITNEDYCALSSEAQKFYLMAEDVKEGVERVKDTHGHIFVKHDLFNHDPALVNSNPSNIYSQNGIAEAFAKFAHDNGLSFAPTDDELEQIMHPENELPF